MQTGKELLLPELPLRLRLIGLRVTKLKDLRSDADKPGSIKRVRPLLFPPHKYPLHYSSIHHLQFFENAGSSPHKKRRLSGAGQKELNDPDELRLTQDGYEDAMPGFYEHEDLERDGFEKADDDAVLLASKPTSTAAVEPSTSRAKSRPPQPVASSSSSRLIGSQKRPDGKPHSTSAALSAARDRGNQVEQDAAEEHTCPICARTLATDNAGLNAHVDYCLSRGAIREAQQTVSGAPGVLKPLMLGAKVGMKRKRQKG